MQRSASQLILPDPPAALKAHSGALIERLRQRQTEAGFLSFAEYMDTVLYEPGLGYYSAGLHKFGEAGDFITAPELGTLFATCLAAQVQDLAEHDFAKRDLAAQEPADDVDGAWDVLEVGAGSGRLAADLLQVLDARGCLPTRYRILERSADLRAVQAQTLRQHPDLFKRVEWLEQPPQEPWQGVMIANEVIDALAVERFRISRSGVEQLGVRIDRDGMDWDYRAAPPALSAAVTAAQSRLPDPLPVGYTSEICLSLTPWLEQLSGALRKGLALFIDYGYPRAEYYRPDRREGTLVCQYRHRAHFDPFVFPGLQDLSAFVDFTALAEAADAGALSVAGYSSQAMFLLGCGLEAIAGSQGRALGNTDLAARTGLAHELRELTLPGAMGEKFQVMGLARAIDAPLRGFALQDLRGRL